MLVRPSYVDRIMGCQPFPVRSRQREPGAGPEQKKIACLLFEKVAAMSLFRVQHLFGSTELFRRKEIGQKRYASVRIFTGSPIGRGAVQYD